MEWMAVSEQSPWGSRQHLELMPCTCKGLCLWWLLFPHCVCVWTQMEKTSIKHKALKRRDSVVQGHLNHIAQLCRQTTSRGWHLQQTNGNGAKIEGKDLPA